MRKNGIELLRRELTTKPADEAFTREAVEGFASTGMITVPHPAPGIAADVIRRTCARLANPLHPLPVSRTIKEPDWNHVSKATLFRDPSGPLQYLHMMSVLGPELLATAQWTDAITRLLGQRLAEVGCDEVADILAGHTSNRAVINKMKGNIHRTAVIGAHTDPKVEKNVNTVLGLGPCRDFVGKKDVPGDVSLTIYACANVAEKLGISQPTHGVSAARRRLSVVFTRI